MIPEELTELEGAEIATLLIPTTVTLVTARTPESGNRVATIAWVMPVSHDPSLIAVSIRPNGSTARAMADSGCFVVNILGADEEAEHIARICGQKQGIADRIAEASLELFDATRIDAACIAQAISWIECEVIDQYIYGDHQLFIGRTLHARTKGTLTESGKLDPLPAFLMGQRGCFGHFEEGLAQ